MKIKTIEYQTARDLPFTKAGHKVEVNPSGCLPFVNYSTEVFSTTEEYVDKLISEGWIEEVKPREWWVLECETPGLLWAGEDIKAQLKKNPNLKFIKVREVIQ